MGRGSRCAWLLAEGGAGTQGGPRPAGDRGPGAGADWGPGGSSSAGAGAVRIWSAGRGASGSTWTVTGILWHWHSTGTSSPVPQAGCSPEKP